MNPRARWSVTVASIVVLFTLIAWVDPKPVYAYLDPSASGGMAQFVIASLIGFGYTVQRFWRRFVDFFRERVTRDKLSH